jgi:tetratricopeptide (TPR) repeat protein
MDWIRALALLGRAEEAFHAARELKHDSARAHAFLVIARNLMAAQHPEAEKALQLAVELDFRSSGDTEALLIEELAEAMARQGRVEALLSSLGALKEPEARALMLSAAAGGLARVGHTARAQALSQALESAAQVSKPMERTRLLLRLAKQAQLRKHSEDVAAPLAQAKAVLATAERHDWPRRAQLEIAAELAELNAVDAAVAELRRIIEGYGIVVMLDDEAAALTGAMRALTRAGRQQELITLIAERPVHTTNDGEVSHSMMEAAVTGVCQEQPRECLPLVNAQFDSLDWRDGLQVTVQALLRSGEVATARRILALMVDRVKEAKPQEMPATLRAVKSVNDKFKLLDMFFDAEAHDLAIDLVQHFATMLPGDGTQQELTLVAILHLIDRGKESEALGLVQKLEEKNLQLGTLAITLIHHLQKKDFQRVNELLEEIEKLSSVPGGPKLPWDEWTAQVEKYFHDAIRELEKAGMQDKARRLAKSIAREMGRDMANAFIMLSLEEAGRNEEAAQVASEIKDRTIRSTAYTYAVVALADRDRGERAQVLLGSIEYGLDRSKAQAALARWHGRQGNLVKAVEIAQGCAAPADRLSTFSFLLGVIVKEKSPHLAPLLTSAPEAPSS